MKKGNTGADPRLRSLGLFAVIVSDLVGCTGAGILIGYWAWSKWGAPWWVLLLTSMAGLVLAFYRLYLASKRDFESEPEDNNDHN